MVSALHPRTPSLPTRPSLLLLLPLLAACGADGDGSADANGGATDTAVMIAPAMPSAPARASAPAAMASASSQATPSEASSAAVSPTASAGNAAGAMAAGTMAAGMAAGTMVPAAAPGPAFAACTYSEGLYGRNCDSLFVTLKEMSPERCVQLTIDNCGENDRGLGGRAPEPWSLDSATVKDEVDECELGVFYPDSTSAQRATGTLSWNETTRLPSEIVLDLTLELSSLTGTTSIALVTAAPIVPSECER